MTRRTVPVPPVDVDEAADGLEAVAGPPLGGGAARDDDGEPGEGRRVVAQQVAERRSWHWPASVD
jgi:hypothetical protein